MAYDDPYRDATLTECNDISDSVYYAIKDRKDYARVMSAATYDVFQDLLTDWFKQPGALSCRFNITDQMLHIFVDGIDTIDTFASFELPFAELVLSAADTAMDYAARPPSEVSAMLRALADQIDAIKPETK